MRDNDSGGFEPEPPKSGVYRQQFGQVSEEFQREPPPTPPPAYATLNRSVDSVIRHLLIVS